MRRLVLSLLLAGSAGGVWFLSAPSDPDPLRPVQRIEGRFAHPMPTENWLAEGAEQANKERRKAWSALIHERGPDGENWRVHEALNGARQIEKRNALAAAPPLDSDAGVWTERGSDNQAGRMHVARVSGEVLYAGSSKGGVWKREGQTWTPIGDNLYGGAHWLEVSASGSVIAATDGGSVHRTDDDGATWLVPTGLPEDLSRVRRLLQGQEGGLWLLGQHGGGHTLFRSLDEGQSFTPVAELGDIKGDLWASRTGEHRLLLASDRLYSSVDGESWEPLAELGFARMELAASEAGAVYLVSNANTLWRSTDGGQTFEQKHAVSDYWGTLNASIVDPDLVAWGGVEVWRSADGGDSFQSVNRWWEYYDSPADTLHADIPGLDVVPTETGEVWYIDTDGGLYESTDGLLTVENLALQGLRVSQYYSTLTSSKVPEHVAAGAQDQGYQVTNTVDEQGEVYAFEQLISGDYAHLTSSDGSHDVVYSVYPGFILVQVGEEEPWLDGLDFPVEEKQSWIPPVVADPEDPWSFFFCATHLYYYRGTEGGGWSVELWSEQDFEVWDGEVLAGLVFSPLDPDRAYATTSWGRVWHSEDKGLTWTLSPNNAAYGQYLGGNAIWASLSDVDTFFVGGNGYGIPSVYRSTDGGATLQPWSEGLPDTLVYSLAEVRDDSGRLFAGTETGVYMRGPDDEGWVDVTGNAAPVTTYWSAEALHHEPTVRFGTYGRGIWDFTPAPVPEEPEDTEPPEDTEAPVDEEPPRVDPEPGRACGTVGAGPWLAALLLVMRR